MLCCQKVLARLGSDDFGPAGDSEAFEELTGVLAGLFDLGDLLGSDRAEVRMGGHVGYVVGEVKWLLLVLVSFEEIFDSLEDCGFVHTDRIAVKKFIDVVDVFGSGEVVL